MENCTVFLPGFLTDLFLNFFFPHSLHPQLKRSRLRPDTAEYLLFLHHNTARFAQISLEEKTVRKTKKNGGTLKRDYEHFEPPRSAEPEEVLDFRFNIC